MRFTVDWLQGNFTNTDTSYRIRELQTTHLNLDKNLTHLRDQNYEKVLFTSAKNHKNCSQETVQKQAQKRQQKLQLIFIDSTVQHMNVYDGDRRDADLEHCANG